MKNPTPPQTEFIEFLGRVAIGSGVLIALFFVVCCIGAGAQGKPFEAMADGALAIWLLWNVRYG